MAALEYWLWLSGAGISPRAKARLLEVYGSPEAAFFAPAGDYARIEGLSPSEAALLEKRENGRVEWILDECRRQNIKILTLQDAEYPERLKNIFAPPPVIYVRGSLPGVDENALIAIIGTRSASPYGLKMGLELAYQTARCGGVVVSLLTNGIDAQAARGALLAGGRCVAVLGTAHEGSGGRLAEDVAAAGAVISEYAPGTRPMKSFFRERNRIAAGLSVGVAVVEAPEKSGTLLFAAEAAEQGKEIFAVPGNADAENSAGTIALLKQGAKLVTSGWDVLCEFEGRFPGRLRPVFALLPEPPKEEKKEESGAGFAKKGIDKEKSRGYIDLKEQLSTLSAEQLKIIAAIEGEAVHIDEIIESTGLPAGKVLAQLTFLEIKGFVRRAAGRRVSLNTAKK